MMHIRQLFHVRSGFVLRITFGNGCLQVFNSLISGQEEKLI
ncbi:hypothetical protein [Colwellia psychrerythraea]|uniref:Uncharacterized protein n=1 Tax=Colwellia psychrerythraea TaxID=28229 RepID=A0A099KYW9_COLPS|nr:hypothetical protein [Colwellia psychrerythraea]KGJ94843.1 hypothetical protein GAB14E_2077 [Colwellia psychrerythraea]